MILYENLEKHFTAPKILSPYSNHKRVPRKFKKRWKHILEKELFGSQDLNKKLWFILGLENPDYKRFLIKQVCK